MRQWCSGLVLSGGRGARMGGVDKGLMEWRGMPMVERVCRRMKPLVGELMVSCNRPELRGRLPQPSGRAYADPR